MASLTKFNEVNEKIEAGLCGVYAIFLTSSPTVAYIGSARDIKKRLKQHWTELKGKRHSNWKLQSNWKNKSAEFRVQVVEVTETEEMARQREQILIDFLGPQDRLLNIDKTVQRYK